MANENEQSKKIRCRNWFITINPKAECYSKIKEIIANYKYNHYAYIYHEADEENENDQHIHLVLELKNARTFEALQSKFIGAHIEQAKFLYQCYKYLIHLNSDNKRKYRIEDVKTDNEDHYKESLKTDEFEKLDTKAILDDINQGINTITEFVRKYGAYQVSRFLGILNTLIREQNYIERINDLQKDKENLKAELEEAKEEQRRLQEIIDKNNLLPF